MVMRNSYGTMKQYIQINYLNYNMVENMENEEFAAAEILFDIAKSEYQNEFTRTSVIDSKVGVTLPIIATYFFLVLQFDSMREIFLTNPDTQNVAMMFWAICRPLIYIAAVVCAGIALMSLFRAIIAQAYQTIDPAYFHDKKTMSYSKNEFSAVVVTHYIEATTFNRSTNDLRIARYKRGWSFALISLFLFVCYVVFTH